MIEIKDKLASNFY